MSKIFIDPKSLLTNRFEVQNKAGDTNKVEMIMYGAIGADDWDDSAISAKAFSDAMKGVPANAEIHLRINSPGGSVFEGNTIYERLKQHKGKKIVYIDGLAASIASVIAMSGDEIHMGDGSFMMIHRPWTFALGNSSDLERTINLLDKLENSMTNIYAKKTGLSVQDISNKLQDDFWMSADEAVDLGFATDKTAESESLHMAASYIKNSKWLKGAKPTIDASNKLFNSKVEELKAKIQNRSSSK